MTLDVPVRVKVAEFTVKVTVHFCVAAVVRLHASTMWIFCCKGRTGTR